MYNTQVLAQLHEIRIELAQQLGAVTQAIVLLGGEMPDSRFDAIPQKQQGEKLELSQHQRCKAEVTILETSEQAAAVQAFQRHERLRVPICF
jgi:hypothetical protein